MKDDQMQKWQPMCLPDTYKKGCKWNDMPILTHYQYITCLTLLSWLMISYIKNLYQVHIFQNAHIAAYNEIHMPTPPKYH